MVRSKALLFGVLLGLLSASESFGTGGTGRSGTSPRAPELTQAPSENEMRELLRRPVRDGDVYDLKLPLVFPLNPGLNPREVSLEVIRYHHGRLFGVDEVSCVASVLAEPAEQLTVRANRRLVVRWRGDQDALDLSDQSGRHVATVRCHTLLRSGPSAAAVIRGDSFGPDDSGTNGLKMYVLSHDHLMRAFGLQPQLPVVRRREIQYRPAAPAEGAGSESGGAVL